MRTTLTLDDEVMQLAKRYAEDRSLSLGKAVSDLVLRGINAPLATRVVNGIHVVELPPNSSRVTSELVRRLEADGE